MSDYIKREDVIDLIERGLFINNGNYKKELKLINDLPKLIHCEECVHWSRSFGDLGTCDSLNTDTSSDNFCKHGKK